MKKKLATQILFYEMSILVICVLLMAPQIIYAQASIKSHIISKLPQKKTVPYNWLKHTEWTTETWTGNDKPYQAVRTQITNALKINPNSGKALLAKYYAMRKKSPANPLMLFRWAYLSLMLSPTPLVMGEDGLDAVRNSFAIPPSPHTYNYTRLRYLLYQHAFVDGKLVGIGARLLKQNPDDFPVQYYYIGSLRNSSDPKDQDNALIQINLLIKQKPNIASLYAMRGFIYLGKWVNEKVEHLPKQVDGDLCIASYQEYLDRAPANDAFRKSAEDEIQWIKTRS